MTARRLAALACLSSMIAMSAFAQSRDPAKYSYMCEDLPPANYLQGGELRGASVEILQLLWKRMGVPKQAIQVMPWTRGYELVKSEGDRVLFSMSRNAEREGLFKWVGPIFTVKQVLFGLAEKKFPIRSLEDAKKYQIGAIKNDISELYLREMGFPESSLQVVSALSQNFLKLDEGRIDLISLSQDTIREYIRLHDLDPGDYRSYLVLASYPNYYAFSRQSPDELIERFARALKGIAKERAAILESYGMDP